jgi:hypothetical protein
MSRLDTYIELRGHPRAQLQLPVRIRWRGPFGMRLETCKTIDVAREGLHLERAEPCELNGRVWVAFPFDPIEPATVQPETPARILRVERAGNGRYRVALRLELPARTVPRSAATERRGSLRMPFAVPIFVRAPGNPWPEESMTKDISRGGARFETARILGPGEQLLLQLPWGDWAKAGEIPARVVRVESQQEQQGAAPVADPASGISAIFSSVAVRWETPKKP